MTKQFSRIMFHTSYFALFIVLLVAGVLFYRRLGPASDRPVGIVVSGDTGGWIVPCGCTANQSGGLLRRGTYVRTLREAEDLLLLDVGGAPAGTSQYDELKFAAICRGEFAMGIDAHNLGGSELALGIDALRRLAHDTSVPFVSSNTVDRQGHFITASSRKTDKGGMRIGIAGVVSPRFAAEDIVITDPREAALRVIAELRKDCSLIVVLAYLPQEELDRFASSLPEADVVLGGPTGQSVSPKRSGPTMWAAATNKGKFLVHLQFGRAEKAWNGEVVEVGPDLLDDPQQVRNLREFYDQLDKLDLPAAQTNFAPSLPADIAEDFRVAGTQSCRECHTSDCLIWDSSAHAHAWTTLVSKQSQMDSYCQQCHTTGYALPDGFVSAKRSPERIDVGCESCHGPSLAHTRNPKTGTTFDAADRCLRCHDRENDPKFAYDEYWPQIEHGARSTQ